MISLYDKKNGKTLIQLSPDHWEVQEIRIDVNCYIYVWNITVHVLRKWHFSIVSYTKFRYFFPKICIWQFKFWIRNVEDNRTINDIAYTSIFLLYNMVVYLRFFKTCAQFQLSLVQKKMFKSIQLDPRFAFTPVDRGEFFNVQHLL